MADDDRSSAEPLELKKLTGTAAKKEVDRAFYGGIALGLFLWLSLLLLTMPGNFMPDGQYGPFYVTLLLGWLIPTLLSYYLRKRK